MAAGYKAGDKAYIVESNRIVRECTVVRPAGNLIIIVMKHIAVSYTHLCGERTCICGHRNRKDIPCCI